MIHEMRNTGLEMRAEFVDLLCPMCKEILEAPTCLTFTLSDLTSVLLAKNGKVNCEQSHWL